MNSYLSRKALIFGIPIPKGDKALSFSLLANKGAELRDMANNLIWKFDKEDPRGVLQAGNTSITALDAYPMSIIPYIH
ncbi:hypothetical protein C5167_006836 [Papaver somniferum]|uniref:Uncharacterized protein n=1 Tax=Papaver somniferum TaxID=3469 RepID=A0A4Y7JG82_PAPSO|nr:hypothetical protein C5167_006836 [Papaver somniferum]